ncbi:MAG: TolC family protein, partial [Odoribacter splanchnicus]
AAELNGSYRNPQDQENVRLGIQIPLMDWGMGKGRVKTAQSQMNVIQTQIKQQLTDHQQDIMIRVLQFNNQATQCRISEKANEVAQKRYDLSMELFKKGTLSVLEFNTAQTEKDEAVSRFITEVYNYWKYYYSLQQSTLYNFLETRNISEDFDKLIQN